MKTLYESLLGDLDNNLSRGNDIAKIGVLDKQVSDPNSELRQLIDVGGNVSDSVYTIENNTLIVKPKMISSVIVNSDNGKLSNIIPDINCIEFRKVARINGGGTKLNSSILAPKIVSDNFIFSGIKSIDGIDVTTKDFGNRIIQKIEFDAMLTSINNCKLEMGGNACRIWFHSVPTLSNVSSSTIKDISIVYTKDPLGFNVKPWSEKSYNNLFDFGYTLDYTVGLDGEMQYVTVKNMAGLKKLVTAKDFYSRIYTEWPVKLKKGAKMSNFFDVTHFEQLDWVVIHDGRMGIICENTKNSNRVNRAYFTDMLKNCYYSNATSHIAPDSIDIIDSIPVTDDGWRIVVVKL